ncbi:hypothetical protein K0U27_01200 [archaeon]|nr:hypothetical protein [archaeon]
MQEKDKQNQDANTSHRIQEFNPQTVRFAEVKKGSNKKQGQSHPQMSIDDGILPQHVRNLMKVTLFVLMDILAQGTRHSLCKYGMKQLICKNM